MTFLNVYQSVCSSFPVGFEGGMWDLIILIMPDNCFSIYFIFNTQIISDTLQFHVNDNIKFH